MCLNKSDYLIFQQAQPYSSYRSVFLLFWLNEVAGYILAVSYSAC